MHLQTLALHHFKNHDLQRFEFSDGLNLITGPNGSGKTNLLDAIYFLCNTKSAFLSSEILAIQYASAFFRIEGQFMDADRSSLVECMFERNEGKVFLVNGKPPEKLASYIGTFPIVLTTPYDTDLIREGGDVRRKFVDQVLSQSNPKYLDNLLKYNRLLKQRNAQLKKMAETGQSDKELLSVYDEQLLPLNHALFSDRSEFVIVFQPLLEAAYAYLAQGAEIPGMLYKTHVSEETFSKRFTNHQKEDLAAQRTLLGIHTDDFEFLFNNTSIKRFGSQGQQKTFALALKIAQFHFVHATKNKKPILLLDDIFDRLDETRIARLADLITSQTFGQVFVTDATPKRMNELFAHSPMDLKHFSFSH